MKLRGASSLVVLGFALALVASCAATDPGITTKVKAQFAADDIVKAAQIDVDTQDGVVTLTGNVDSVAAKDRALQLARDTEGVVSVVDMLAARMASGNAKAPDSDRTFGEVIDDAGITVSVKSQLLDDPLVKGLQIDVDTRDGVVFLTGDVNSDAERRQAIQLAENTEGVRDVQANLTVQKS